MVRTGSFAVGSLCQLASSGPCFTLAAKAGIIPTMQDPAGFFYHSAFICFHLRRKYPVNSPD
jgi:hypothetical protein